MYQRKTHEDKFNKLGLQRISEKSQFNWVSICFCLLNLTTVFYIYIIRSEEDKFLFIGETIFFSID